MIVCADDYGLKEDIDGAILELAGLGRLSAVSCMVVLDRCGPSILAGLLKAQTGLDLGLHLCLTDEGLPLSSTKIGPQRRGAPPRFSTLLRQSLLGKLQRREMALEVSAQYKLFVEKCGRKPDYIDGHLHVHQLPGVREGVLDFVGSLSPSSRPYVRNTHLPQREVWRRRLPWLKTLLIGALGARMRNRLGAASIPTNQGFAGIYDFENWRKYPEYFPRFIASLRSPNALLVVHPGHNEPWRQQEFTVLRGFDFPADAINRFQPLGISEPASRRR